MVGGGEATETSALISLKLKKRVLWTIVPNFSKMGLINLVVTQWFSQFPMITAGPKDRAGFMLAPV